MNENHHEMIMERTQPSGQEEWYCPTCGMRFLLQRAPAYKMIVLERGNRDAQHSVGNINIRMGQFPITQTKDTLNIDEFRLIPWQKWMEKVDFNTMWGRS